jgi:hypothetical protein
MKFSDVVELPGKFFLCTWILKQISGISESVFNRKRLKRLRKMTAKNRSKEKQTGANCVETAHVTVIGFEELECLFDLLHIIGTFSSITSFDDMDMSGN